LTSGTRKLVPRRGRHSLLELIVIVAIAIGLALLIQAFLLKPYRIPSESMEPTLDVGQRVLVSRFNYHFSDPDRLDVVVFHPPRGADTNTCGAEKSPDQACPRPTGERDNVNFIKRIVAGPGDKLRIDDGKVVLNGKPQNEPFAEPCGGGEGCDFPTEITIPSGMYFMMGDNRGSSDDSRFWGPVPEKWIIGQAFATYWPPKRIGLL
jgi:signal peptidase I